MAQLLGAIANIMERATRPPPPPVDHTLPKAIVSFDNLDDLTKQAKEFYKMDKPGDFHIAMVGAQGAGKSSLINGLCNMRDTQPGAAPVGESNNEAKAYRNFMTDTVVFWEMPGAGVGHPSLTYFADKKLYAFDLLILVSDRFQRIDFEVAKSATRLNRRFIFVRTKADLAAKHIVERQSANKPIGAQIQVTQALKTLQEEVQASFREGLRICGLSEKWNSMTLFLVSAKRYVDGPHVYNVISNARHLNEDSDDDEDEEGGHKLDEDKLIHHLTNLIRIRAVRRTRTLARRSQLNMNFNG